MHNLNIHVNILKLFTFDELVLPAEVDILGVLGGERGVLLVIIIRHRPHHLTLLGSRPWTPIISKTNLHVVRKYFSCEKIFPFFSNENIWDPPHLETSCCHPCWSLVAPRSSLVSADGSCRCCCSGWSCFASPSSPGWVGGGAGSPDAGTERNISVLGKIFNENISDPHLDDVLLVLQDLPQANLLFVQVSCKEKHF